MERATTLRFLEQLRSAPPGAASAGPAPTFTIAADRYRDASWFEKETALFRRSPRIAAVSASLERGDWTPLDLPDRAVVLTRDADGSARAFSNACRHRGTRLVDVPCRAKAMVCPYHAWTYDPAGRLIHLPHADAFVGIDAATRGLVEHPVSERHGLVWLGSDIEEHLGALDSDVAVLAADRHVMWKRARVRRRCNWKLVVEAFLDGYHIRSLHRDSIYRFFLDAASVAEPVAQHVRSVTARRAIREAPADLAACDLRTLGTPTLHLFPATVIVEHPDFLSIMTVHPVAPDVTDWDHMMLVSADRAGEAEHWDRSWALIEEGVFQKEDLWVCEQAQRSLMAGATDEMLFGSLEFSVRWFHDALERALV